MTTIIEYRVRPVTRYIVTRFEQATSQAPDGTLCASGGGSSQHGEFDNYDTAYAVGYALCKAEHDRLGWPPLDERIRYPEVNRCVAVSGGGGAGAANQTG